MQKILLSTIFALALSANCLAASSINIDGAKADAVLNFASNFYTTLNPGFTPIKSNTNSTILAAKRKDSTGTEYLEQTRLGVSQRDKYVIISCESAKLQKDSNGKLLVQSINMPGAERVFLATLKGVFNDHYRFGYVLSNEYKSGGFVIDMVELGSAAREAGLKPGDILTHVNKKALLPEDEGFYTDKTLPSCFTGKETEFTILREGISKTLKITPSFEPALLR